MGHDGTFSRFLVGKKHENPAHFRSLNPQNTPTEFLVGSMVWKKKKKQSWNNLQ